MSNPKKEQILKTAKELFWKYGIKRVSVEEICAEANVSKMTFYKYFRNKIELAKLILQNLFNKAISEYREIMDSDIQFIEKVEKTIQLKMDFSVAISQEFINDLYKNEITELQEFMQKFMSLNMQMIYDDYIKAQKDGYIRQDIKVDYIMFILNKMIDLVTDEQLSKMYETPQEMIKENVNFFFYGILPHPKPINE